MITLDDSIGATAFHHWSVRYRCPIYLLGITFVRVDQHGRLVRVLEGRQA